MTRPLPPAPPSPSSPIAWALLSQTIWLPLLAIDLHDRWQAHLRVERERIAAAARVRPPVALAAAAATTRQDSLASGSGLARPTTGVLLEAAERGLASTGQRLRSGAQDLSSRLPGLAVSGSVPPPPQRSALDSEAPALGFRPLVPPASSLTAAGFRRSDLLGGSLTLADLQRPAAPALALAEQARWSRSGDPLAPLPTPWREPMRRALQSLSGSQSGETRIDAARVVHVPSRRVRSTTTVPLALQADGSVDILSRADDPAVIEEVRHWSLSQPAGGRAGVTATLLHLDPMPAAPVLRPAARPEARGAGVPIAPSPAAAAPAQQAAIAPPPPMRAAAAGGTEAGRAAGLSTPLPASSLAHDQPATPSAPVAAAPPAPSMPEPAVAPAAPAALPTP